MPVPSAISENMLRLRWTSEAQPRSKNGQPAQSTTGVAKRNCSQGRRSPVIARRTTGTARTRPIQKRRVMSASSGLGSFAGAGCNGSSAMPQSGQAPGLSLRISGCIGQVQIVPGLGGSSAPDAAASADARYFFGSAMNFSRHLAPQKK